MKPIIVRDLLLIPLVLGALAACSTTLPTMPTTAAQTIVVPATIGTMSRPTTARSIVPAFTPVSTKEPSTAPGDRKPTMPPATAPVANWIRRQFAKAWDIEYPEGWTVSDAGLHEGNLSISGAYGSHRYQVVLSYPIFQRPAAAQNLDAWIEDAVAALAPAQRRAIQIQNITVAGTPAKKVLYLPEKIFDDGVTSRYLNNLRTPVIFGGETTRIRV